MRLGWTEQDIWQSSPDFVDALIAQINAETAASFEAARQAQREQAAAKAEAAKYAQMSLANLKSLQKQGLRPLQ